MFTLTRLGLCLLIITLGMAEGNAAAARVYELRTYTTLAGKLDALLTRFRAHTLALFERHEMENVLYTVPVGAKDGAGVTLVYLIAHESRAAAQASWAAFRDDPEWQSVAAASQVDGKIVSKVESVFLAPADYSPLTSVPAVMERRGGGATSGFVYELRTYTTPPGKLAALDARFGGGETALFEKHGMRGVGYFHPLDEKDGAGRTLVYILAHASGEAAAASWAAFRTDPAWVAMKAETEKDGSLTEKVVSVFLAPTDFSPLR